MLRDKLFWIVVCAEALVCFAIWRGVPHAKIHMSNLLGWGTAAFLSALVLAMFSETRKWIIAIATIVSPLVANIANIGYDLAKDPNSHNLFPFELFMTTVVAACGALVGAVIGTGLQRKALRNASSRNKN
jgi:uncharacterized oligopeptide transporter (OPT) family protein